MTACSFDAVGVGPGDTGVVEPDTGTASGPGSGEPTGTSAQSSEGSGTGGPVQPMTTSAGEDTTAADTSAVDSTTADTSDTSTTATTADMTTADSTTTGCVEHAFFADADGDGFGSVGSSVLACEAPAGYVSNSEDCDDGAANIHPGGQESCDTVDNDCDELVDEFTPDNTLCGGCKMALYGPNNTVYHFCEDVKKWAAARDACEQRDAVLAKDDDLAHHEWLLDQLPDDSGPWWIGGSSPDKDGEFEWLADGSAVPGGDDERWFDGHPLSGKDDRLLLVSSGNIGSWMFSSGRWYSREDKDQQPYICQSPYAP